MFDQSEFLLDALSESIGSVGQCGWRDLLWNVVYSSEIPPPFTLPVLQTESILSVLLVALSIYERVRGTTYIFASLENSCFFISSAASVQLMRKLSGLIEHS